MSVDRAALSLPAVEVAPRLLGAVIASGVRGGRVAVRLTEVEAYEGAVDEASHGFRGPTARNAVMFGRAGHLYVYFTYGMHWCANIVCGAPGQSAAVLLRAGEVVEGVEVARRRRPAARLDRDLARGPARLATCLGLSRTENGLDLCDPGSSVRLEHLPDAPPAGVRCGPRVGIRVAIDHPWRFWLDDPTVSPFRTAARKHSG